jgi:fatty-acid desaturase
MVRVSLRVENTQEAQQLGGAVVLPLVVLAVGQTTGLLIAGPVVTVFVGFLVWLIAGTLNWRGMRAYRRNTMAARL